MTSDGFDDLQRLQESYLAEKRMRDIKAPLQDVEHPPPTLFQGTHSQKKKKKMRIAFSLSLRNNIFPLFCYLYRPFSYDSFSAGKVRLLLGQVPRHAHRAAGKRSTAFL